MTSILDRRESYADNQSSIDSPPRSSGKNGVSASKDRHCPFCHQAFTSSSLGRHLDLYIKERNPKAPDGVHNVEEIRRMRSKITRRHARLSAAQKAQRAETLRTSSPSSPRSPGSVGANGRRPETNDPSIAPREETGVRLPLHKVNWHATGVMSHLPSRQPAQSAGPTPAPATPKATNVTQVHLESLRQHWEDKNNEKAAELALREVLRSVHSAHDRASRKPLFHFNFFSLNFPALCLQLLPPPSTIFSTTPSPSPESWPLLPPGGSTFEAANNALNTRVRAHPEVDSGIQSYRDHLTRTFHHWQTLSSQHQQEAWQLEIMRALTVEREYRKIADENLERATAENEHLRAQMEQIPEVRQYAHWYGQPSFLPGGPFPFLGSDIAAEMKRSGQDVRMWDMDKLMARWRSTILRSSAPVHGQQPGPEQASTDAASNQHDPGSETQPLRQTAAAATAATAAAARDMPIGYLVGEQGSFLEQMRDRFRDEKREAAERRALDRDEEMRSDDGDVEEDGEEDGESQRHGVDQ